MKRFTLLLFAILLASYSCVSPVDPIDTGATQGIPEEITVNEARQWYQTEKATRANARATNGQDSKEFRLERVLDWEKANSQKSNRSEV